MLYSAEIGVRRNSPTCPPAPERFDSEERLHQPTRVRVELLHLVGPVPFAQEDDIHLLRRRAVLEHCPHVRVRRRIGRVHEPRVGIDRHRPDLVKRVPVVALLQDDLDGLPWPGKAQRLMERPVHGARLARRLPLAVDRGEAAGVDDPVRGGIDHLEQVLAQVRLVDEPRQAAGPRAVRDDAVEPHDLFVDIARVEVVHTHRLGSEVPVENVQLPGKGFLGKAGRARHDEDPRRQREQTHHQFPFSRSRAANGDKRTTPGPTRPEPARGRRSDRRRPRDRRRTGSARPRFRTRPAPPRSGPREPPPPAG